ncbi:hypothetical protein C5L28_000757 [Lentilactobacillus parakefiri]|uniref:Uncharacterized protein n=1 Tax=Lentilactobacillus parakefiri TaxID=152332 RepID=A0A224VJ92_9LACO|nr:hypothetical protein C5L28_000757 [Lentilactobacillus parakefiri]GAW72364.1 hypothetical protein LPKJCM_01478 [Lentilactobacillus parakefiri]
MPFFVIKKGLVLLEWKYFPTPKILDPEKYCLVSTWLVGAFSKPYSFIEGLVKNQS